MLIEVSVLIFFVVGIVVCIFFLYKMFRQLARIESFIVRNTYRAPSNIERIFISFRTEDSAGHAGRLCWDLRNRLGIESVFMDPDILPGDDWKCVLEKTVRGCGIMIVVIGRNWAQGFSDKTNNYDSIINEIQTAIESNLHIIPVLVHEAPLPSPDTVPPEVRDILSRQSFQLRDRRWEVDSELFIERLQALLSRREDERRRQLEIEAGRQRAIQIAAENERRMREEEERARQEYFRNYP